MSDCGKEEVGWVREEETEGLGLRPVFETGPERFFLYLISAKALGFWKIGPPYLLTFPLTST